MIILHFFINGEIKLYWIILLIAGLFEIGWAISMKYSNGFSNITPTILMIISMTISVVFLSIAIKHIPVGTGYAVWTGIGAAGTAIVGMIVFNESTSVARLISIFLIIAGIIGLKIFSE